MGTKVVWIIGLIPIVRVTTVSCLRLKVANMLVVGSMVGPFKFSTMFGLLSVGMTILSSLCCHGYGEYQL